VIAALCLIGVFASVVASCSGQNVTTRLGDPNSSGSPVAQVTMSPSSPSATERVDPGGAASAAGVSQAEPPVIAVAPPIAPTPVPGVASNTPTKSLVLTSTRPAPTSKPTSKQPSAPGQYVTPGAACARAGAIGLTSTGKRAICWTNASRNLVWIVF